MSSSNYIKISQLDKLTTDKLKSTNGILDLPVITTNIESGTPKIINLASSEIGKTVITSGLGDNFIIDVYLKPDENTTFSFNDLGLYWPNGGLTFEYISDEKYLYPYASIVVNDSPAEIYRLKLEDSTDNKFKLISCDWKLENSQYKKITNKISICIFHTANDTDYDTDDNIKKNRFKDGLGKISLSELFLSKVDLIIININPINLIIDKNINVNTNLCIPLKTYTHELSIIGNLPICACVRSSDPGIINFTKSFSSDSYFEGTNITNITGVNRTTKINNGKFINSNIQPTIINSQFKNYEILESDYN